MKHNEIIGFHGLKGCGKTTAAEYLKDRYGFTEVSFAQPMKASLAALFNITLDQIEEWKNDKSATIKITAPNGITRTMDFRTALQRYGTEAHRDIPEFGRNCWTDMAVTKLDAPGNHVVADCRFVNEAETVRGCGGKVIHIVRDAVVGDDNHPSESLLPPELIDLTVDNNGRVEDLFDRLDLYMGGLVNGAQA